MFPCLFVSADFGLLKFGHFVVLLREEDFWAEGEVRRDGRWLCVPEVSFHISTKNSFFEINELFGVWPKYYS